MYNTYIHVHYTWVLSRVQTIPRPWETHLGLGPRTIRIGLEHHIAMLNTPSVKPGWGKLERNAEAPRYTIPG